jgi:hypothetical protein
MFTIVILFWYNYQTIAERDGSDQRVRGWLNCTLSSYVARLNPDVECGATPGNEVAITWRLLIKCFGGLCWRTNLPLFILPLKLN